MLSLCWAGGPSEVAAPGPLHPAQTCPEAALYHVSHFYASGIPDFAEDGEFVGHLFSTRADTSFLWAETVGAGGERCNSPALCS